MALTQKGKGHLAFRANRHVKDTALDTLITIPACLVRVESFSQLTKGKVCQTVKSIGGSQKTSQPLVGPLIVVLENPLKPITLPHFFSEQRVTLL